MSERSSAENLYPFEDFPIWVRIISSILPWFPAVWSPASNASQTFLPSSLSAVALTVHMPSADLMKSMDTTARISLVQALRSISFSNAMFMLRNIFAPT